MSAPLAARLRPRSLLRADGRLLHQPVWAILRGRTLSLGEDPGPSAGPLIDLPVDVLPGLVNAHAHLDLSGSAALPAEGSFPDWLTAVAGARQDTHDPRAVAARAARRLAGRGVTLVADIDGSRGLAGTARRDARLGGRSDWELLGVAAEVARRRLAHALGELDRLGAPPEQAGLSIHSPYSVHEEVVPEIARAARAARRPLSMHLAESEEETRFLLHGDGPFVAFLDAMGLGRPFESAPGQRPVAYAARRGVLGPDTLVVHANDLDPQDIALLAEHRSPVVMCPGTHRHFGRPRHPFLELHAAGVVVALGTDSSASNEGVDMLSEMGRLVEDRPDVAPSFVLQAATLGGRRALRQEPGAALFEPGTAADAVFFPAGELRAPRSVEDLLETLLGARRAPCLTLHAGHPVLPLDGERAAFLDTLLGHG